MLGASYACRWWRIMYEKAISVPWREWIPGVLSRGQVETLITTGFIQYADRATLDYSSLDLTLSNEAYELTQGSVKPSGHRYLSIGVGF